MGASGRGEKKTHPIYMREGNPTLIPLVRGVPIGRGEERTPPKHETECQHSLCY